MLNLSLWLLNFSFFVSFKGNFYVSYFTYRNLSLNLNGTNEHPIFMGPLMVHLKRDFDCYFYFTEQIKYHSDLKFQGLNYSVLDIKLIITDDDESLKGALKKTFIKTDFLLSCNHIRKNIVKVLKEFELDECDQEKILFLIFGGQNERENSLIASKNKKQYIERLNLLTNYFETLKRRHNAKSFGDWFLEHKAKRIFDNFIIPNTKYHKKLKNY